MNSSLIFRLAGLVAIVLGVGGWWYNHHLAAEEGRFYIKLCVFSALAVPGGLLMILKPEWCGPIRPQSTPAHKLALSVVIGLMAVGSGIDFYSLKKSRQSTAPTKLATIPPMPVFASPQRPTGFDFKQHMPMNPLKTQTQTHAPGSDVAITFMGRPYQLASFNKKRNATWEFVPEGEHIDDWKTLVTVIDRPDAHDRSELDRLAEGIMSTYKANAGQILMAKTMQQASGEPFNYMVVAFEQPAEKRFEINFVKAALNSTNAVIMIYATRISDAQDSLGKGREFLNHHSSDIGRALGEAPLPDISKWPRKEF